MTELSKPIRRRCQVPFKHYKKRIVVTLLPGDRLRLHLERDRTGHVVDLATLYTVKAEERRQRRAARNCI